jgi:hypothetical protein
MESLAIGLMALSQVAGWADQGALSEQNWLRRAGHPLSFGG